MNEDQILNDLDVRARQAAADLGARAAARPVPAFDPERAPTVPLAPSTGTGRSFRRPTFIAAAAIAVVALLAGGLWFGTRDDASHSNVADEVVSGSIQPYMPESVPDGLELAGVFESDGNEDRMVLEGLGPLVVFGPEVEDPRLAMFALRDGMGSDSSEPDGRPVRVGDRTGYVKEIVGLSQFGLEVPANDAGDGPSLILFGRDVDEATLIRSAEGTTLDGLVPTVSEESLPDGWGQLTSVPDGILALTAMGSIRAAGATRSTGAYYQDSAGKRSLLAATEARSASTIHLQRLVLESAETVTVRGHDAVIGRYPTALSGDGDLWQIRWEERPGEIVSIDGFGIGREDLIEAAESLRPVESSRWKELLEATALGDLAPQSDEDRSSIELGRGRFADGTAWVLRYSEAGVDDGRPYDESLDLDVAISGDSTASESFAEVGAAIDADGNTIEQPPSVFGSVSTLEKADRTFGYGLLRDDVARVEVRATDGSSLGEAELIVAEGKVAWVVEVPTGAAELVAFAADGTELGTDQLPGLSGDQHAPDPLRPGDSSSSSGSDSGGEGFTEVGEAIEDTIPAPTTTGG